MPPKRHHWTRKQIAMLGTMPDAVIARKLDLNASTVFKKRHALGITASRPPNSITWTPEMIALLGIMPDYKIAAMFGMHTITVRSKRVALGRKCYARKSKSWHFWTKKEIALLGTMPDGEVALKIGQKKASVAWKRAKLNIPPFGEAYANKRPPKPLDSWTRREIAVLGKMTDANAAKKLNLAHSTVHKKRVSLGIPPYGRQKS